MIILDDLDRKLLEHFRGFVVKKDLVRSIKVGANVPVFVLEYLIANSCSTDDEEKISQGMDNVKKILSEHYVNPEESELIKSKVRENGRHKIIDKISVQLDSKKDKYWAHLLNSNIKDGNIGDALVNEHEKMMLGGIWAIIDMEYDPLIKVGSNIYPYVIREIRPIQLSSFDNSRILNKRKEFTKEEWLNVLLRSSGYEPSSEGMTSRVKMLLLSRLIPLVEANFNFVELGPRSTGKSFVYKELTPYAVLISGGQGTVPKLFVHGSTGKVGAVGQWDAICFDEATDRIFKEHDAIPLMKDYMESGSFSRAGAGGEITGVASIIFNGNINQPVETVLQTSHLFSPLSDEVNSDTAFLDRIHFYLPGWEMLKFAPKHFTNNFGFSTDYFSETLKAQRRINYTDALDKYFTLGSHLKQRDTKPVKKTISGFIKLLHPDGQFTKQDVQEYLEIALEMRRRVKEQLKRIGGMEFWDTNFSYIDKETQEEKFVGLPEEKGSHLIESTPLKPGVCYTSTSDGDNLALVRVEVVTTPGSGKLNITGTTNSEVKENIKNTYQYIRANEKTILNEQHSLKNYDVTVQVTNLLGPSISSGIGSAVYIAIISSIYKKNLKPGLAVLGNISVGGAIERAINFPDKVTMLSENGARTVVVPMDNLKEIADLPPTILGNTDVPFYSNNQMLMQKGLLGNSFHLFENKIMKTEQAKIGNRIFNVNYDILTGEFDFRIYQGNTPIPSILYKYYSLTDFNIEALKRRYFFGSHPRHFNDPFDCYSYLIDFSKMSLENLKDFFHPVESDLGGSIESIFFSNRNMLIELATISFAEIMYSKLGLLSLSSNPSNIQMWAYYTNQKGFQIGISTDKLPKNFKGPIEINYVSDFVKVDINYGGWACLLYQISTKDIKWKYEQEWRYLITGPKELTIPDSHINKAMKDPQERIFHYSSDVIKELTLGYYFFSLKERIESDSNKRIFKLDNEISNYDLRKEFLDLVLSLDVELFSFSLRNNYKFEGIRERIILDKIDDDKYQLTFIERNK